MRNYRIIGWSLASCLAITIHSELFDNAAFAFCGVAVRAPLAAAGTHRTRVRVSVEYASWRHLFGRIEWMFVIACLQDLGLPQTVMRSAV